LQLLYLQLLRIKKDAAVLIANAPKNLIVDAYPEKDAHVPKNLVLTKKNALVVLTTIIASKNRWEK